ncbi:hypothetical protein PV04_00695 [Phialophora macrospora]|uniref:Uncharacterized protein n=1 Tax=Phialophora macrospora TaxID=1851006 RepID=A0A0D2G1A7_9EURO|nr:hypothetical protein PV04_00695 [Phialophora macrospora]
MWPSFNRQPQGPSRYRGVIACPEQQQLTSHTTAWENSAHSNSQNTHHHPANPKAQAPQRAMMSCLCAGRSRRHTITQHTSRHTTVPYCTVHCRINTLTPTLFGHNSAMAFCHSSDWNCRDMGSDIPAKDTVWYGILRTGPRGGETAMMR